MKTLDPLDPMFSGKYRVSDQSDDWRTAGGFNYHQGPEWVWLFGCYLQCIIISDGKLRARSRVYSLLRPHLEMINASEHGGLVELTDAGGDPCPDSCQIQAWSMATILDALISLEKPE